MNVRAQRERQEQFKRERTLLQMREAVVSTVAPAYLRRLGSSAVFEAVDEALAQLVAAGTHLGEPEHVKALWITCARRRLIDEQRSAESKHRDTAEVDEAHALADSLCRDLSQLTEEGRQWWRIREVLSILRGDQRKWAEAWYDQVLSGSLSRGGQPRGLAEALGWTPSKTKSVSRRARRRMAAFIDDRAVGAVCDEQRALLDAFIMAGTRSGSREPRTELDDERYAAVLFHIAGCEDCWAAWHTRRRVLLGRCRAVLLVPVDGVAVAADAFAAKLAGLATDAHGHAYSLAARLGIGGGAAAAGGGAATIGGKAAAVCVGVACAATAAGGELVGVLPPMLPESAHESRGQAVRSKRAPTPPKTTALVARRVTPPAPPPVAPPPALAPAPAARVKAAVRKAPVPAATFTARPRSDAPFTRASTSSTPGTASRSTSRATPRPAASFRRRCTSGSFGC